MIAIIIVVVIVIKYHFRCFVGELVLQL